MEKHPIESMIESTVDELGFDIVRVSSIGIKNQTLQIMIERKDRKNLVVEDCAKVSRAISVILDEKDPIKDEYSLEVSSPGLDRPLTKFEHFERFVGYEAKLETRQEVDKRKRFKGRIINVDENQHIDFEMDGTKYSIPFEVVTKAKLILTDELLQEYCEDLSEVEI